MPFEMSVDGERRVLIIRLEGKVDLEERRDIHRDMVKMCRQESLKNILVDVRDLDVATSTIDLYDFGTAVQETGLPFNIRIAGVCRPDDADSSFPVTIAKDRFVDVRAFEDVEEALEWLVRNMS